MLGDRRSVDRVESTDNDDLFRVGLLVDRQKSELSTLGLGEEKREQLAEKIEGLAAGFEQLMAKQKISELPVVDAEGRPVGLIDITDVVGLLPKDDAAEKTDASTTSSLGPRRVFPEPEEGGAA